MARRKQVAFGRRTKKKKARRISRKVAKKKYSLSIGTLASKKIDSLLEKRIVEISKQQAAKVRLNCVLRQTQGVYDDQANEFESPIVTALAGNFLELAVIPRADYNAMATAAISDITGLPGGTNEDESDTNYGAVIGLLGHSRHGHRTNDTVQLRSFFCKLRIQMDESSAVSEAMGCTVTFAIVRCQALFDDVLNVPNPSVNNLLPFKPWTFSRELDVAIRPEELQQHYKVKVLAKKTVYIGLRDDFPDTRFETISYKFKDPMKHEFQRSDTNLHAVTENQISGKITMLNKYFLVYRSDCPESAEKKPQVHVCAFTNYYDE